MSTDPVNRAGEAPASASGLPQVRARSPRVPERRRPSPGKVEIRSVEAARIALGESRQRLQGAISDLEYALRESVDPRRRLRASPLPFVAAALAFGLLLGLRRGRRVACR